MEQSSRILEPGELSDIVCSFGAQFYMEWTGLPFVSIQKR